MSRLLPVLLGLASTACLGPAPDTSPPALFDALWTDFDLHYGLFLVKDVDWPAARDTHGAGLTEDSSERELSDAFKALLTPFADGHVFLADFLDEQTWTSFEPSREPDDLDFDVVTTSVVSEVQGDDGMTWGHLSDDVGYVFIHHFGISNVQRLFARVLDDLGPVDSLVIDIRDNPGGTDAVSAALGSCFASEETPFLTVRLRNGPNHDDFDDPIRWSLEPEPSCAFDGPVVLVSNQFAASAAEVFSLAMVRLPQVTHIGEHTQGAFSDVVARELANGWVYGISIGDWRDADDVSHEGRGVVPSIDVVNTVEANRDGRDLALERALDLLTAP